ncbi:hypothetical protein C7S18_23450 (plasmid) [Ahniella affigens]|uniref:Conjugal transfer protein TraB n=1 Tax=Ahniella affigens TaxID=2021234 RepID=A0A2P1PZK7_9GAMM|nr:TraB/VirB10 family protein [Ahniella affigens]AVQ00255.1 hypothetical protein C7S18_23450 [Ahniella affigens]
MSIRKKFEELTPQGKRNAIVGVGFLGVALTVVLFSSDKPAVPDRGPESVANVLTPANPKDLGLSAISAELDKLRKTVEEQRQAQPVTVPTEDPEVASLRAELQLLQDELRGMREAKTATGGSSASSPQAMVAPAPVPLPPPPAFQTIEDDLEPATEPTAMADEAAEADSYLPAGTLVTGKLLYGLDASTASAAIRNPQPVVVRIKHDAILPNRFRFDVRECFLTAAGYGDLSSERVMLRSENLSCVRQDGAVLDIKLEAIAVGEDGKVGLRGKLVSKQGRAIGLATLAGIAEGASQALGQGTTFVTPGSGDVLSQAGGRGLSSSLDRVAEFYIEKADQLSPILEVSSAREVTFALVTGAHLQMVERPKQG